jgi:hypothetical protein
MNIKVAAFSRELRRKFGTPQRLLDALGMRRVDISRLAFDEEPETLNGFLKRSGLTRDQIAEFHRLCREGAEDDEEEAEEENDGFDPLDDAVNKVLAGIAKLEPGDATSCNEALHHIVSQTRNGAQTRKGATDDIPTYRSNGTPRNNAGAMDSQIASGPRDVFGAGVDLRTVRFASPRPADDRSFLARFPEAGRIRQQWDR